MQKKQKKQPSTVICTTQWLNHTSMQKMGLASLWLNWWLSSDSIEFFHIQCPTWSSCSDQVIAQGADRAALNLWLHVIQMVWLILTAVTLGRPSKGFQITPLTVFGLYSYIEVKIHMLAVKLLSCNNHERGISVSNLWSTCWALNISS